MERIRNLYLCAGALASNEELTMVVNAEGRTVFDWVGTNVDERFAADIIDTINGTRCVRFAAPFAVQEESITYDGLRILDIGGWAWLRDIYGLTGREAEAEQQEFLRMCVGWLNGEL